MRDATARRLSSLHRVLFRATGGYLGKRLVANDMLLLTTTGRVTGQPHTVPLLYLADGDAVVVIASWGGRPNHPEWFLNLEADPEVEVVLHRRRFIGTASEMAEPERTAWWDAALDAYAGYGSYQSRTDRVIPVVRISPH